MEFHFNQTSDLHLLNLPDDNLDQIINNLAFTDLITCKLVCHKFNESVKRVLASVIVLEDSCDSVEVLFTLLPELKNVHIIRHFALGTGDEVENDLALDLLTTFCLKIAYFQYAPVSFVSEYIARLEEKNDIVFISKIKVCNSFDLNSRELSSLIEKYPYIEIFIDEMDLQSVLDESWYDEDELILRRITGLNPGMLKLNSPQSTVAMLLSRLSNLRSLWIKISIENVHLISSYCSRLKYLYIEDVSQTESSDFSQIETLIKDKVSSYTSFSLCISSSVPLEKVKTLLNLLCQVRAKFHLYPQSEWLSCDLCLGDIHVWTKEQILYVKFWPPLQSLTSMLSLFLPVKRIQVEQQVLLLVKDKWEEEIETFSREKKVKLPLVTFIRSKQDEEE